MTHEVELAAYAHAAEEIRFYKQQQWQVTYYSIILQGGIVAAVQLLKLDKLEWTGVISISLSALVGVATATLLLVLNRSLTKQRERLRKIFAKLPDLAELHTPEPPANVRSAVLRTLLGISQGAWIIAALVIWSITHSA